MWRRRKSGTKTESGGDPYAEVPYESFPFEETHLWHLNSIAVLAGLNPAPPERCRVLEFGCAGGGNIIPMAYYFPDSRFVGVDLSEEQISAGQKLISGLGLNNIELRCSNAAELDAGGGFDYVIAHGIFSWVPEEVQTALLQAGRRELAPEGLFYLSYNTLPGWRHRMVLREFLRFHSRSAQSSTEALAAARTGLELLVRSLKESAEPHLVLLRDAAADLEAAPDWYLFHEYLRGENRPVYFSQLLEQAAAAGLQYLTDADLTLESVGSELEERIAAAAQSEVESSQYRDFAVNRRLRRSLLVHATAKLDWSVGVERLRQFRIASALQPDPGDPFLDDRRSSKFLLGDRGSIVSHEPLVNAALLHLSTIWPLNLPYADLLEVALRGIYSGRSPDDSERLHWDQVLAESLHAVFLKGALKLESGAVRCVRLPCARPRVSRLALAEAVLGPRVTGARHQYSILDPEARSLLLLLNGERDCAAVFAELEEKLNAEAAGKVDLKDFQSWFEGALVQLARRGLLEE